MFNKRKKVKTFPPDTFIPTPARVISILQLCLAFTAIFWMLGKPFTEETFRLKKQRALFQSIVGNQGSHPFFLELPEEKQRELKDTYHELEAYVPKTKKIPSPLGIAWIALSLALPILLLKKVPSAVQAIWLFPLVTLLYGIDNSYFGKEMPLSRESSLFPTEKAILSEPLTKDLFAQQAQIKKAWEKYLVKVWSPNDSENIPFETKLKYAEHRFAIARFEAFASDLLKGPKIIFPTRLPIFLVALYFFYHLFIAIIVHRSMSSNKKSIYTKLNQC